MRTIRYDNRRMEMLRGTPGDCGCRMNDTHRCVKEDEMRMAGTKTGAIPQGRDMGSYRELKEKLMCLYFVMTELELFLDGHPDNCAAIARYKCAVKEYEELAAVFEKKYGPLLARNNDCANEWLWVREPWPWEV